MNDDVMGLPWYESPEEYSQVVAMLPASEGQDPISYDAFRAKIEDHEKDFKSRKFITIRVPIDAVTLKGWCDANNLPVCRASIAEYVQIIAVLILNRRTRNN